MAPSARFATTTVVVPCAWFQPSTLPSSVSNRNSALPPVGRANPAVGLKTAPVGALCTLTTSGEAGGGGNGTPSEPRYNVDLLVWLSATHHGVVGPEVRPQALTRFGSVFGATPGWSETSGMTLNEVRSAARSGETATIAMPTTKASANSARMRCAARSSPTLPPSGW